MDKPLISVIVPIFNVEKYLRKCLDSAKEQTFSNIEIICINDGSTDSSPSIIREYVESDPRFKLIDKPNSGYGASMNLGLSKAMGKYIAILESDDFYEPEALEILYNAAERFDAQVVKANFWLYWSTPKERNELFELVSPGMSGRIVNPQEERDIFYLKPSIWSALYRRDYLEQNDIRFLETPGASYQDAGFNFKVWANAERVAFLHEPVLHYRQDNEASSVNSPSKVYCVCDEYAEMSRFLSSHPEKQYLIPVMEKMKYDSYMWNYDRLSEPLREEFIVRFSDEFRDDSSNGLLDVTLFEPWKRQDLDLIIANPMLFHVNRSQRRNESMLKKVARYFKMGGLGLVFTLAWRKLTTRNR